MAVTLEDLLNLPENPSDEHLNKLGLLKPPPEPASIVLAANVPKVTYSTKPVAGAPAPTAPILESRMDASRERPTLKPLSPIDLGAAPDLGSSAVPPAAGSPLPSVFGASPTLDYKQQMALPTMSAGVHPGTSQFFENQLERMETAKEHPATGVKGALQKAGNIALDVFAPGVAAAIPGTDIFKRLQEERTFGNLEKSQAGELREKHEENIAGSAEKKIEQAEEKINQTEEANKNKDSAALAKQGLKRDTEGNIIGDEESPIYKANQEKLKNAEELKTNLNSYRQAQTDLAKARTEVEKAKNDPNSPAYKQAQLKLQMAEQAHEIAAKNLELHESQFANKLSEQELLKPSGQAQSRGSAAQSVLDLIPDLKGLVEKHREDMGPIMGRINRGEVAIGNVDPEVARLYSAMKSFYALQPAVHGFRNAEFVKDFEHALGTLERDPDAFIAGMEGLKPTLEAVAKEGRTFHKREVEGKTKPEENKPAAPEKPAEPPRPPQAGMKWQRSKKTGEFREVPIG